MFSGQPDKQLVINSYINNRWGAEERFPNPFEIGQPFQIRILVLENYFKIAVNGKHICDYPHRVPVEEVKTIYVGGNIRVDFIEFQPPVSVCVFVTESYVDVFYVSIVGGSLGHP
ncbi:galactoside-binding lectin [Necator americanus]|uniref:Galectin n=1 Tax=Necator americanus TaxID=51031 RepID=W2TME8_NECAM|nr:galactoside-binding lectin [Necator americanus]ETN82306.1 galactoside-binding lectin [Necator americanus]